MEWKSVAVKVATYFWSVDKLATKASNVRFPGLLWDKLIAELLPQTGKDPKVIVDKLYHYAQLAPHGVRSRLQDVVSAIVRRVFHCLLSCK